MRATKNKLTRGFTLVETMTSVFILGLIILLIGYEFDHTISHLLHTQANVDAESGARTISAKIVDGLKAATPDSTGGSDNNFEEVIIAPVGGSGTVLRYRRAAAGSLANPVAIATGVLGQPTPPFYDVTVECMTPYPAFAVAPCSATTPEDLVETVADDHTHNVLGQRALGHDVTGFTVDEQQGGDAKSGVITITLTVGHPYDVKTGQYSTARCSPTCQYTMTSQVFVGGQNLND